MTINRVGIECEFIALTDEFSLSQFGKINLLGLNPGEILSVSQIPYHLVSTIVIQGVMWETSIPQNISLGILYKDENDFILSSNTIHYPPIPSHGSKIPLSLVLPFRCNLTHYGKLQCSLLANGLRIKTKAFQIVSGNGPYVNSPVFLASSGTIHKSKGFELEVILKGAKTSLTIIDQYLNPNELIVLIKSAPNTANVRVLTNPSLQKSYEKALNETSNLNPFPEVRFSKKFHDRFLIINSSDHYHFGHSFKDLSCGRISRYSKLYGLDEINELNELFEAEWKNSEQIIQE